MLGVPPELSSRARARWPGHPLQKQQSDRRRHHAAALREPPQPAHTPRRQGHAAEPPEAVPSLGRVAALTSAKDCGRADGLIFNWPHRQEAPEPVSYTHLTLPTILLV